MKKRIFTLLALGMLIGGFSSALKAQTAIKIDSITIDQAKGNNGQVFEHKSPTEATLVVKIRVTGPVVDSTLALNFKYTKGAAHLGLPANAKIALKNIPAGPDSIIIRKYSAEQEWNMPNSLNGDGGKISAMIDTVTTSVKDTTFNFYNRPQFAVSKFIAVSPQYDGVLEMRADGGKVDSMYKYITYGTPGYYTYRKMTEKFSQAEIASLLYSDSIYVSYLGDIYSVPIYSWIVDPNDPNPVVLRPVTVPAVSDATLSIPTGIVQTPSGKDFSFVISTSGSNSGLVPVVTTGRTSLPDSEGVTYKDLGDGNWLVTIVYVQEPINLSISFTTSNASIENNSVWTSGNQLYVNAATNGSANIYSITGALVKTMTLSAGETANVSLSKGLYVVTVNGKAYKVTAK